MIDFAFVHETNPNDAIGGGGCLATGGRPGEDCKGKWINFHRVQTEEMASPYAVICEHHLEQLIAELPDIEVQAAGDVLPLRAQRTLRPEPDLAPIEATPFVKLG